ncbi:hypothetical protein [Pasteuria penetrans]|uniref:hypothetical protein n=1 Tax=Pasteuria penetrans TaxID=86005 RepID=UPI000FC0ABB5|nr:hypothetical protein [Pasteuria penetrans]
MKNEQNMKNEAPTILFQRYPLSKIVIFSYLLSLCVIIGTVFPPASAAIAGTAPVANSSGQGTSGNKISFFQNPFQKRPISSAAIAGTAPVANSSGQGTSGNKISFFRNPFQKRPISSAAIAGTAPVANSSGQGTSGNKISFFRNPFQKRPISQEKINNIKNFTNCLGENCRLMRYELGNARDFSKTGLVIHNEAIKIEGKKVGGMKAFLHPIRFMKDKIRERDDSWKKMGPHVDPATKETGKIKEKYVPMLDGVYKDISDLKEHLDGNKIKEKKIKNSLNKINKKGSELLNMENEIQEVQKKYSPLVGQGHSLDSKQDGFLQRKIWNPLQKWSYTGDRVRNTSPRQVKNQFRVANNHLGEASKAAKQFNEDIDKLRGLHNELFGSGKKSASKHSNRSTNSHIQNNSPTVESPPSSFSSYPEEKNPFSEVISGDTRIGTSEISSSSPIKEKDTKNKKRNKWKNNDIFIQDTMGV